MIPHSRFSTSYLLKCNKQDSGGFRTDECRKIGKSDSSYFTYVGYHADKSDRTREAVDLYLPLAESRGELKGPCEIEWGYCPA